MEAELFLHFHALKKVRGSGSGASQPGSQGGREGFYILGTGARDRVGGARLDHSGASEPGRVGFYILGAGFKPASVRGLTLALCLLQFVMCECSVEENMLKYVYF